jgi:hypothetical protein
MEEAGFTLAAAHDFLERQSFLVFEPAGSAGSRAGRRRMPTDPG